MAALFAAFMFTILNTQFNINRVKIAYLKSPAILGSFDYLHHTSLQKWEPL
ncbi:MAG: hypothetical protein ABIK28_24350 [Planctomycetota bacterium]